MFYDLLFLIVRRLLMIFVLIHVGGFIFHVLLVQLTLFSVWSRLFLVQWSSFLFDNYPALKVVGAPSFGQVLKRGEFYIFYPAFLQQRL